MKKKKLLYLIMISACILFISSTVKAETNKITLNGGYNMYYEDNGDGTVRITRIKLEGEITNPNLVIPAMIDGKKVERVEPNNFSSTSEYDKIKSLEFEEGILAVNSFFIDHFTSVEKLKIPSTMISIQAVQTEQLKEIEVAQGNTMYCSEDGILFNKDKTELIIYPAKKDGESYIVPNTVKRILSTAFDNGAVLKTINIPASVTYIERRAFERSESCEAINVDAANFNYSSVNGILFNKDKTELLAVTNGNKITTLALPDTLLRIGGYAIYKHPSLNKIIMPQSLAYMSDNAIIGCHLLKNVIFKGKALSTVDISYCGEVTVFYDSSMDNWEDCIKNSPSLLWKDYAAYKNVSELEIDVDSDHVAVGNMLQMRALLNPSLECDFNWTSSNDLVATVSDTGKVIGFKAGTVTITASSSDGKYTASKTIVVTGQVEIKGNPSMKSGEAQQLQCTISKVYSEQINWSSSDSNVVAVSAAGVASAWHEGMAVITCKTKDGKAKASFTIQVTSNGTISSLDKFSLLSGVTLSQNRSSNNYTILSSPVKSYLYENADNSLTRVEYVGEKKVVVENYRLDKLESSKTIDTELDIFGGFYHGKDYNYFVYGALNTSDSDDVEVIRVVKYDKDFNRIASKSIRAVNTYIPFEAGSLRMEETAGKLYIYTCHKMYKSSDRLHHQANMTFVLNEETLEIEDSYFGVMNIAQAGYVSHSFNQFIKTDGKNVYRVDHGDAHPRAVSITKCDVNGKVTSISYSLLLNINGQCGENDTGVSVGGLELSDNNCIVAGNSVDQSDANTYDSSNIRNIFVSVADKDLNNMQIKWFTNYTEDNKIRVYTPQLVKIDEAHFLIMWEERNTETGEVVTKAATIDEDATITSSVQVIDAQLSDCQPITTVDKTVKWYVTDGNALTFYQFNPYALDAVQSVQYGDVNHDGDINITDGVLLKKCLAKINVVIDEKAADVNGNGAVDIADAVLLLKHLAGMNVTLGK